MSVPEEFGPTYPALPASVAKHRRRAAAAGGVAAMDRKLRREYGAAVGEAIRALQRSELRRASPPGRNPRCASGTAYTTGKEIHEAIRRQHRAALASYPDFERRNRPPDVWWSMYRSAMKEKNERHRSPAAPIDGHATAADEGTTTMNGKLTTIASEMTAPQSSVLAEAKAEADGLDIPEALKVKNRTPLTAEQKAKLDAIRAERKAKADAAQASVVASPIAEELKQKKKAKSRVRVQKLLANKSGEAAKMPLQGKEALAAIEAASPATTKKEGTVKKAVKKTKAPVKADKKVAKAKPTAKVVKTPFKGKAAAPKAAKANGGSKTGVVAELLKRKSGCTNADILGATGWPTVSVPQMAKAAGLKLRKVKEKGEPTRYYGE